MNISHYNTFFNTPPITSKITVKIFSSTLSERKGMSIALFTLSTSSFLPFSSSKKYKILPVDPETNPRYSDADARRSYEQSETPKPKKTTRKQSGAPTFPATMTVAGATSSVMKGTGTEGRKAKRFRRSQQNIKSLKDYESGRRQRAYEDRISTSDFFSGLLGSLGSQKAYPSVLDDIAEPYRRKKGGSLGVKMAKGGFKKKTPIY